MFQSQDVSKATFLPEALGKNLFPCHFEPLQTVYIPQLMNSSFIFKVQLTLEQHGG